MCACMDVNDILTEVPYIHERDANIAYILLQEPLTNRFCFQLLDAVKAFERSYLGTSYVHVAAATA